MAPRNHAACVVSYCDAILSGEIIAGRYVELAVRRYLDDIAPSFPEPLQTGLVGRYHLNAGFSSLLLLAGWNHAAVSASL